MVTAVAANSPVVAPATSPVLAVPVPENNLLGGGSSLTKFIVPPSPATQHFDRPLQEDDVELDEDEELFQEVYIRALQTALRNATARNRNMHGKIQRAREINAKLRAAKKQQAQA